MSLPLTRVVAACVWSFFGATALAGESWQQYANVEQAGFAPDALAAARRAASEAGSTAIVVVHGGQLVAAWGEVAAPLPIGAIETSLASLLLGIAHGAGRLDLDATLASLGIDDVGTLTEAERAAKVGDVLRTRSNVWHPAAGERAADAARRPPRGSSVPGRDWQWNGWDANVLGELHRLATGRTLAEALADSLAAPLCFEDFDAARDLSVVHAPTVSRFDARLVRLSARDLARVGQLVADEGSRHGRAIVSASWLAESTTATAPFPPDHERGEGNGFGRMWWTVPRRARAASHFDRYAWIAADGGGGDRLLIAPAIGLVIVHRGGPLGLADAATARVVEAIVAARRGPPADDAALTRATPLPLRAE